MSGYLLRISVLGWLAVLALGAALVQVFLGVLNVRWVPRFEIWTTEGETVLTTSMNRCWSGSAALANERGCALVVELLSEPPPQPTGTPSNAAAVPTAAAVRARDRLDQPIRRCMRMELDIG